MDKTAGLDIVIPVLKEEGWLPDLMSCLLKQDLTWVHIYVSCSCDTDSSEFRSLRRQYHTAPSVTVLQAPLGVSCARNRGATQGRSDWILFLDADVLIPDFFLSSLKNIARSPTADAFGFKFYADSFRPLIRAGARVSYWYLYLLHVVHKPVLPGFSMLVKRSAFESVGGFRDGLAIGEDFAFTEDLRKQGFTVLLCRYPWVIFSVRRFDTDLRTAARVFGQYLRVELARVLFREKYCKDDFVYSFGCHVPPTKRRFPNHIG
jgi:glycosyltransferase involved in cell wall biosynthesis